MEKGEKKYKWLTYNKRMEVIEVINKNKQNGIKSDFTKIGKQFNVSRHTIRRIVGSKENFTKKFEKYQDMPCIKKRKRTPNVKNDFLEEVLYEWYKQIRAAGNPVSTSYLKEVALRINEDIEGNPDFKASNGWLDKFKSRYAIRLCSVQGDKSSDLDSIKEFVDKLSSIMRMRNFQLYQIYNADETELLWRNLPSVPFINKYKRNEEKMRFLDDKVTLMICTNADGSHKIPLFVIGKTEDSQCLKNNKLPVIYESQKNAWMTRELFRKWYIDIFLQSVKEFQALREESYKILLIIDNASCHLPREEINSIDNICNVEFIPPNVSDLIQPMDEEIVGKMKNIYRKSLLKEMLLEENENSIIESLKTKDIKNFCIQIASAWAQITNTNISRGWRLLIPNCHKDIIDLNDKISVNHFLQILIRIPGFKHIKPEEVATWLFKDANTPGWEVLVIEQILLRMHTKEVLAGNYGIKVELLSFDCDDNFEMEYSIQKDPLKSDNIENNLESDNEEIIEENNLNNQNIENEKELEVEIVKEEALNSENNQDKKEFDEEIVEENYLNNDNNQEKSEIAFKKFCDYKNWLEERLECQPEHLVMLQQLYELTIDITSHEKIANVKKNILSFKNQ